MSIKETLRTDMVKSMKAKEPWATQVLRNLVGAITVAEKDKRNGQELSEDEVTAVLNKVAKRCDTTAEEFRKADHIERAEAEEKEAAFIRVYLPAPMTQADIEAVVAEAVAETGVTSMKEMSKVMKAVMARDGMNLYGKEVSAAVRSQLA